MSRPWAPQGTIRARDHYRGSDGIDASDAYGRGEPHRSVDRPYYEHQKYSPERFDRRQRSPAQRGRSDDQMYHFRGNGYGEADQFRQRQRSRSPQYRRDPSPPSRGNEPHRAGFRSFDFRHDAPHPVNFGPPGDSAYSRPRRFGNDREAGQQGSRYDGTKDRRSFRQGNRPYQPAKAADRPFLQVTRAPTPDRMAEMEEENDLATKYRALEDMSDSDEADMDMSADDEEHTNGDHDDVERPKKRRVLQETKNSSDGNSVPRWSNPDPYTALPPSDDSQRKKKDVVKLIRKARVTSNADDVHKSKAETDDFISFDFMDGLAENMPEDTQTGNGVPGAPAGPRYSHRDQLHEALPAKPSAGVAFTMGKHVVSNGPKTDRKPLPGTGEQLKLDWEPGPAVISRKRSFDDNVKDIGFPRKKKLTAPSMGAILPEWLVLNRGAQTPWCRDDYATTAHSGVWLHKEIMDFYEHVKPQEFEQAIRTDLVNNLRAAVQRHFPGGDVYPFGSFVAGLYLPTADMDIVVNSDNFMDYERPFFGTKTMLHRFKAFLSSFNLAKEGSAQLILHAKVPLVKYIDRATGLRVDVSFENRTGIVANRTFLDWSRTYPAMPILVTIIKQFLAMRGLNEPVNGGIGGFTVICLVVSLLQQAPHVQSGVMIPEHHLGELLMRFFDLYGNEFNSVTTAISLLPPAYIPKSALVNNLPRYKMPAEGRFSVIDPNNPQNDICGGASNTPTIVHTFAAAFKELTKRMSDLEKRSYEQRKGRSILGVLLAGNYRSFVQQRERLHSLHSTSARR